MPVDIHGHRGARGLYPENTLTAFEKALLLGVDALEMDVVISGDGQVVVSHEPWMNALFCTRPDGLPVEDNPAKYNLYKMTYHEIASYDCGKRGNKDFPSQKPLAEHKPLLREVIHHIETCTRQVKRKPVLYNIEIKTEQPAGVYNPDVDTFVNLVYSELKTQGILTDRCHLQSFDHLILQKLKQKDPFLSIGLLVENKESLPANLNRLGFMPNVYSPDFELMEADTVQQVHSMGPRFIPWTVNAPEDIKRMIQLGCDGIITDYPDRALNILSRTN